MGVIVKPGDVVPDNGGVYQPRTYGVVDQGPGVYRSKVSGVVDQRGDTPGQYDKPPIDGVVEPGNSAPSAVFEVDTSGDTTRMYNNPGTAGIARIIYVPNGDVFERPPAPPEVTVADVELFIESGEYATIPIVWLVSQPYQIYWKEAMGLDSSVERGSSFPHTDDMLVDTELLSGSALDYTYTDYLNWPPDPMELDTDLLSGSAVDYTYSEYREWPPEPMELDATLVSGSAIDYGIIEYLNYIPEGLALSDSTITGGTLV